MHYTNFEHRLFLIMLNLFQTIFLLVLEACRVRRDAQIMFLKLQLAIMRKHLGSHCHRTTKENKVGITGQIRNAVSRRHT